MSPSLGTFSRGWGHGLTEVTFCPDLLLQCFPGHVQACGGSFLSGQSVLPHRRGLKKITLSACRGVGHPWPSQSGTTQSCPCFCSSPCSNRSLSHDAYEKLLDSVGADLAIDFFLTGNILRAVFLEEDVMIDILDCEIFV